VQTADEFAEIAGILHLHRPMKDRLNQITETIIGAAIEVHRELGPGLLESAYEACLCLELIKRGLTIERQKAMPLVYQGVHVGTGYRVDLLVEGAVVVEVKAVERIEPVHLAQILTYLQFTGCKVGLLLNFNVKWLTEKGIRRVVNAFPD
jgi:GxxExxY protein